ncbi:MAG: S9 family peptidase [Thermoanaerobaculia bacterium]|nr:S9 family peptidase [Thermoanaerobaculia bacterium]
MRRTVPPALLALLVAACASPETSTMTARRDLPEPPRAKKQPQELVIHGHARTDPYFWLREREDPEVIAYLEAENEYTEAALAHTAELQEKLYEEIVGRIQEIDESVPFLQNGYYYYYRYEEGGEYQIWARKKGTLDAPEEILLDGNKLAEGHEFFALRGLEVSRDNKLLAYAVDTVGRRKYERRFRDLATGEDLPDVIPDVTSNGAWANDDKTFFYTRQDPETLRWYQIKKHVLGEDPAADEVAFEETDEEFNAFVYKTKTNRYLMIGSEQTLSSEYRYLDADTPDAAWTVFLPREEEHEYSLDHFGDHFYVRTNWEAKNFRLMRRPTGSAADKGSWEEVIGHRDDVFFNGFETFRDHLVASERKDGLIQMRIMPWDGGEEHYLDFGEPAYAAYFDANEELDTQVLRYSYSSLTTPWSVYDYDMVTREKTLRKEEPVLGGFDKNDYVTERLMTPARDGVQVPISIVYRKGFTRDGSHPLLLYGYGSYGASMDASFRSYRLSLLDRGFAFAIAHIRGGQEMGRDWYEDGKLRKKMNTFTDFVDCARFLVDERYTSPERLYAEGGSAGGLLMGAVANLAPELFDGIVSHVPFVDVVTTMLDDDIPLTTSEYDEWGNPNVKEDYEYILSYSPYDNLEAKEYPHMLVTTGLHDSQVQYWEPAKYVAKLRDLKTDDNLVVLKTNMEAGHGGASGRFKRHKETALTYAFLLDLAGKAE